MPEYNDWELTKHKLELFQGSSRTEQLREKLVKLAEAGITHVDSTLAKVAVGESSIGGISRNDPSHDFNHAMRVLKLAESMAIIGGDDIDVVRASVLLHDLITYPKNMPGAINETADSAEYAEDLLKSIDFPEPKIKKVIAIINNTSLSKGARPLGSEGYIVYDADKLDQSGAMAVMRYFTSGGQMNRAFYNPEDPFVKRRTKPEVFKYTVDALLDRLPRVVDTINIPHAKATAKQRNEFFDLFLAELKFEISEQNTIGAGKSKEFPGAFEIMAEFDKAGKEAKVFYDQTDPFCEKREPDPNSYPLDAIISSYLELKEKALHGIEGKEANIVSRRLEFLKAYFSELQYELEGELVPPPRFNIKRENWQAEQD